MVEVKGIISISVALCLILNIVCVDCWCKRKPVIFNFGDSNSDTGGYAVTRGRLWKGRTSSASSMHLSDRLSDGKLVLDFLCESLRSNYLSPYLESLGSNFSNGANFAISGVENLVGRDEFKDAKYMIDIGQNDLWAAFHHSSYAQVIKKIPSFISEIEDAICNLYEHGARNFWVHNTGPLGCLPERLATTPRYGGDADQYGCLKEMNEGARVFNDKLHLLCDQLRYKMKNASIVYVDTYSIKYDLFANSAKYGFENPLMACCGYGGPPHNYNSNIKCGQKGYTVCKEGSRYISWDGVHYTEAANQIIASKILSTNFSSPQIKFNYFCNT
ncbi:GDSL esterase/lipase [Forsythia ovata]|uniref:GDSL esterase/lipase n=1 Tax=Forsythia ovata TaxID=205694 RepID=A0ABD1VCY5_9LAMI